MIRVLLVDDEPPARARLRQLLSEVDDVLIVGEASDALQARTAIGAGRPDVVFLDIEMPELSGTALAGSLLEPRPFVVFATAFDRYALDAFAVDATDYLVKPISRARLGATLARVRERLSRRSDLERDLAAASVAQAALLPRHMPEIAGFDAAAVTLAARGVSGDFFVAQAIGEHRFVLALGDVAGKGMPAGLVASSVQARIEAVARHAGGEPADVVAEVNRTLCATSEGARFATLAYLDIDARSGQVAIVNAGHLPILLLTGDGDRQLFAAKGPALGLFPAARFTDDRVTMAPGATMVICSDGVTDAFDVSGEEFGDARFERVAGLLHGSAAALCQAVVDEVRHHTSGAVVHDDITVLALQRRSA